MIPIEYLNLEIGTDARWLRESSRSYSYYSLGFPSRESTYHRNHKLLMPLGIDSLFLGLGFVYTLSIESENGEWVGFASSVECKEVMTA